MRLCKVHMQTQTCTNDVKDGKCKVGFHYTEAQAKKKKAAAKAAAEAEIKKKKEG